ncbi:aromatic acid exporter family protein [Sinobaca sp. H24]|uniref:aromatic acid exporter family protein n=1 Tax=Sinobaca sp. H24 TaxID=2923376 RepID=UPI00207ACECF|nr:aromatic acid exporter family protein [Sinobaca sp. H24]
MIKKWVSKIRGERMIKTALAVFFTVLICRFFELPPAFAVIAAVVTLEPTAADSVQKGLQRFPATLIGTALSLGSLFVFGQSAIAFTLAAVLTIYICYKLRLEAGILVATLTAVLMIPVAEAPYLIEFIQRAGTTLIGISVSTIVNLTILPPHFSRMVAEKNDVLFSQAGRLLLEKMAEIVETGESKNYTRKRFSDMQRQLNASIELISHQKKEWKYHRYSDRDMMFFTYQKEQLYALERIIYHTHSLFMLKDDHFNLFPEKQEVVNQATHSIANVLEQKSRNITEAHYQVIEQLDYTFRQVQLDWPETNESAYHHHFSGEVIILYVLLSIHDVLEELEKIHAQYEKDTSGF